MTKITYLCLALCLAFSINFQAENASEESSSYISNEVQRVRINFVSPNGAIRQLLLGFTPDNAATDGFDYGYDGQNIDNFPDDMNWLIEDERYIIQGVGAFDTSKRYPLGMFLSNSGTIQIILHSLENFEQTIDVFVHDTQSDTYTQLNNFDFTQTVESGDYTERFFLTFLDYDPYQALTLEEQEVKEMDIHYSKQSNQLILTRNSNQVKTIKLYNVLGKKLLTVENPDEEVVKIPLNNINVTMLVIIVEMESKVFSKRLIISN